MKFSIQESKENDVKLGALTGLFFFNSCKCLKKDVSEMCLKEFKKRRKECISLTCVAGVTIL